VAIVVGAAMLVAVGGPERPRACADVRATASDFREARRGIEIETPTEVSEWRTTSSAAAPSRACRGRKSSGALGRPDGTSATPQIDLGNAQYDYHLGPERSYISIDSETLEVRFGSDRTVGRGAIHRD